VKVVKAAMVKLVLWVPRPGDTVWWKSFPVILLCLY
jgi:hypothetical protein